MKKYFRLTGIVMILASVGLLSLQGKISLTQIGIGFNLAIGLFFCLAEIKVNRK